MSAAVGVQPMAERVRLGVNGTAVELVRDDRSVLPDLSMLIASLPARRRA